MCYFACSAHWLGGNSCFKCFEECSPQILKGTYWNIWHRTEWRHKYATAALKQLVLFLKSSIFIHYGEYAFLCFLRRLHAGPWSQDLEIETWAERSRVRHLNRLNYPGVHTSLLLLCCLHGLLSLSMSKIWTLPSSQNPHYWQISY